MLLLWALVAHRGSPCPVMLEATLGPRSLTLAVVVDDLRGGVVLTLVIDLTLRSASTQIVDIFCDSRYCVKLIYHLSFVVQAVVIRFRKPLREVIPKLSVFALD
jgi:hypothetical protein